MPGLSHFARKVKAVEHKTLRIRVDALARVEGEGGIELHVRDGRVLDHRFRIFEPPRFFEAFLLGRSYTEVPDITARICGICPVAYQMSSVLALERALGVEVDEPVRVLRRLMYCGEWIESHALHVLFLHAPDFLRLADAFGIARLYPDMFRKGLELKKAGNDLVSLIGGREVHPVNMKVGGFHRMIAQAELDTLKERLKRARDHALDLVAWVSGFSFPDFSRDYEFVALCHPTEYPMAEGEVTSSLGLTLKSDEVEDIFVEEQVDHSHALHASIAGREGYVVGPLARFNLNHERLSPLARQAVQDAKLDAPCTNPFRSIVVRAVEILQACDDALTILEGRGLRGEALLPDIQVRAGRGSACTEAPRGLLHHRYELDEAGLVRAARIMPPTSQNQRSIESDLLHLVEASADLGEERLTWLCEQAVRNYDPCISCATHSLRPGTPRVDGWRRNDHSSPR